MTTSATHYDAIVIGAGQAGGPLATALSKAGKKTALIEREHAGGTCVNEGCTPTKTMVASARAAYLARRGADYGVHTGEIQIDMVKIRDRKRRIVDDFRGGSERGSRENTEYIEGEARFTDEKTVEVTLKAGGTRSLSADMIFLNVGARPSVPPIPGLSEVPYLNSTSIMELDVVPEHLIMIGGGYIALEFGQMFRRFGAAVTIIERDERLLTREDPEFSEAITKIFEEDGIELLFKAAVGKVEKSGEGVTVTATVDGAERTIHGSHLLVAVGRTPNTDSLNLDAAGVSLTKTGSIIVNERLETNVPGIYALGDVKGGPAFTHISYDDFRIVRDNLLHGGVRSTADRPVPYTMFIDPQFSHVGLSESEARKKGLNIKVVSMPMSYVARALEVDETRGLMKSVVDADSGQILGFTVLGIEGGELMTVVQMAMMGKLSYKVLTDAVFSHPTLSESLNNLYGQME